MKLSEFKQHLSRLDSFEILFQNGTFIPKHFHITEMGVLNKKYTDCGNTFREENYFTFQLWYAEDTWHRLTSQKTIKIIEAIEKNIVCNDYEILVEYQDKNTIGKYTLDFQKGHFVLLPTQTTCLAQNNCGIPNEKIKKNLSKIVNSCTPNSGCC
ncbi:hypothetical protein B0A78_08990 [Flavobacterium columnare NBRC 100251 = ATCC 23463]|uniref:Uncharacterized protein n=2 Tax=Flavobacterium columnare TaxID=996 RepID=G8X4F8_FLACA|nr:DUF6428 family protein [Flavobacterium columnare]AEW85383.1 hypothetical protein FCOL_02690 [Flavobacterium columnare ATCC 49512]AMO19706.1 hypothetical protein UN65_04550 [Flavobacterium columnare]ANO48833.1 hypothetical protein Pf1_00585 [Flavobacterium columnare]APT23140.1 hypothetical protein BU993_11265 [Flavobacterium columnare]AUX17639.1 hypothetical protein AQ623_04655 [Flavobacterium columnare]